MSVVIIKLLQRYWSFMAYLFLAAVVYSTKDLDQQHLVLAVIMLLLPVFDGKWKAPDTVFDKKQILFWVAMVFIAMVLIRLKPELLTFFFSTLIFAALPEEWFFRAYLMEKIGKGVKANIIASMCFVALHAITHDIIPAMLVFIPSLMFGWVYQKQRSLVTVVLLHAISNLIYAAYLYQFF